MASSLAIRSKLSRLEKDMEEFSRDYHYMTLRSTIESKEQALANLRSSGYPYFKEELEDVLAAIKQRIDSNSDELSRQMTNISNNLLRELRQASFFSNISKSDDVSESILEAAERETNDFGKKLKQGKDHYFALIDSNFEEKMNRVDALFKRIEYYSKMREEASFEFNAGEKVVMADKAEWVVTGKGNEDPDGIFFLTDQRILFEQKETTGKFLGMFGGQKQHGLQWEYPLSQINAVSFKDEGMLKGKDMLTLEMKSGSAHSSIVLEVKGDDDNSLWSAMVEKALQGALVAS